MIKILITLIVLSIALLLLGRLSENFLEPIGYIASSIFGILLISLLIYRYSTKILERYFGKLDNKMGATNKRQIVLGFTVGLVIFILYLAVAGILMAGGPPDSVKIGFAVISLIIPISLSLIYFKFRFILWRAALYTSLVLSVFYIVGTVIF